MTSCERILIVGGGIAGLTAAIALQRRGYTATVIERTPSWEPAGAGLSLGANAMAVFESLGIAEDLDAVGHIKRTTRFLDMSGAVRSEIDLVEVLPPGGHELAIHRAELLRVLLDHQPSPVRWGCTLVSLRQHAAGVTAELSDATTSTYDLVIGADGVHSQVRALLFPSASLRFVGQVYWRGSLEATVVEAWTHQIGVERFFGVSPVGCGRLYWFAQLRVQEPIDDRSAEPIADLRAYFAEFGPPAATVLELLDGSPDVHFGPIYEVELRDWVCGSVVVIGDAAHCVSPIMSQGGGMAVEDAVVLAEELDVADTVEEALASFVERRRPRVNYVRDESHNRLRTMNVQSPPPPSERGVKGVIDTMRAQFQPLASPP
jgi:2-polyprenyl-6-methoxyphenol hydroxylase-like FAD-dependent oxidoreductase